MIAQAKPGQSRPAFDESVLETPPLTATVTVMLGMYFVILIPQIPCFTLTGTGMAFLET
jgi:hypothetical protein